MELINQVNLQHYRIKAVRAKKKQERIERVKTVARYVVTIAIVLLSLHWLEGFGV